MTAHPALSDAANAHAALAQELAKPAKDLAKCQALLQKAKLALALAGALVPTVAGGKPGQQEVQAMVLARDILELGALTAVHQRDLASLERYLAQLHAYYHDASAHLPASPRMRMVQALHLLALLAQSRIADFHASLEKIPTPLHATDAFIKHAVALEHALMEGAYNHVWRARGDVPCAEAKVLVDMLVDGTVRDEIARGAEAAYEQLALKDVATLLFFAPGAGQLAEAAKYCAARGWLVDGGVAEKSCVKLASAQAKQAKLAEMEARSVDAKGVVKDVVGYARELERIV